jgi:hypothetical protein
MPTILPFELRAVRPEPDDHGLTSPDCRQWRWRRMERDIHPVEGSTK